MEEDKIESFFKDMRTADAQLPVPPFPQQKEPRRLRPVYWYAAAAAVVAILITARYASPPDVQETSSNFEIILVVGEDPMNSHSLLESGEQDLSTWKSPTDFLSEDF